MGDVGEVNLNDGDRREGRFSFQAARPLKLTRRSLDLLNAIREPRQDSLEYNYKELFQDHSPHTLLTSTLNAYQPSGPQAVTGAPGAPTLDRVAQSPE